MSVASLTKFPASSFTNLKSNSLQVNLDLQCTPIHTSTRNTITPSDGMIIFHVDDNQFEGYYSGGWNSFAMNQATDATVATGTLSSSNIDNLSTIPITLIPGQGTGTVIIPSLCVLNFIPGSTPYTNGDTFTPNILLNQNIIAEFPFGANSVLASSNSWYEPVANESIIGATNGPVLSSTINNIPITITDVGSAPHPSAGNGVINWLIIYTVLPIG